MTRPATPSGWMLMLALFGLLAVNAWAYSMLSSARDAALLEMKQTEECHSIADRLRILRQRPALAGSEALAASAIAHRIEQAAGSASIPSSAIVRIVPQAARRLSSALGGETPFMETPTQVQLQQVSLAQLVTFLHSLTGEGTGLHVTALRLSAPRDTEAAAIGGGGTSGIRSPPGSWTVELTFSYWLYSPKAGPTGGKGDLS